MYACLFPSNLFCQISKKQGDIQRAQAYARKALAVFDALGEARHVKKLNEFLGETQEAKPVPQ